MENDYQIKIRESITSESISDNISRTEKSLKIRNNNRNMNALDQRKKKPFSIPSLLLKESGSKKRKTITRREHEKEGSGIVKESIDMDDGSIKSAALDEGKSLFSSVVFSNNKKTNYSSKDYLSDMGVEKNRIGKQKASVREKGKEGKVGD